MKRILLSAPAIFLLSTLGAGTATAEDRSRENQPWYLETQCPGGPSSPNDVVSLEIAYASEDEVSDVLEQVVGRPVRYAAVDREALLSADFKDVLPAEVVHLASGHPGGGLLVFGEDGSVGNGTLGFNVVDANAEAFADFLGRLLGAEVAFEPRFAGPFSFEIQDVGVLQALEVIRRQGELKVTGLR